MLYAILGASVNPLGFMLNGNNAVGEQNAPSLSSFACMRIVKMRSTTTKLVSWGISVAMLSIAFSAHSATAGVMFSSKHPVLQASGNTSSGTAKKPKKERKTKGKKGGGVTFYEGSGETRAERDRRLKRECRGRSNSGLCEGYTR
jgi:hypothetical protein